MPCTEYQVKEGGVITRLAYDNTAYELYVELEGKSTYKLICVPPGLYHQFMKSESLDTFFAKQIKNRYSSCKYKSFDEAVPQSTQRVTMTADEEAHLFGLPALSSMFDMDKLIVKFTL
jgi:hypothetical protein